MSILANDDTEGFVNAVESGNVTYLTKIPWCWEENSTTNYFRLEREV